MQVLVLRLAPLTSAPLTDDTVTHEQSQGSETRERSTLTVVSRKQENEAMGVGTHGICTVIMLNLQGRETHGSKTRLVGLSKLCRTLGATIKTHGSVPRAHSCHSLFPNIFLCLLRVFGLQVFKQLFVLKAHFILE